MASVAPTILATNAKRPFPSWLIWLNILALPGLAVLIWVSLAAAGNSDAGFIFVFPPFGLALAVSFLALLADIGFGYIALIHAHSGSKKSHRLIIIITVGLFLAWLAAKIMHVG